MHPFDAADLRDRQMTSYDEMIDRIMDDEGVEREEAEERYDINPDKLHGIYEPDGCDA